MTTINSVNNTQDYSVLPDQTDISAQFGGDAAAELAAMMFIFSRERRNDAAEQRELTEGRIQEQEALEVEELRDAADDIRASAVVNGGLQIAGGVLEVMSAGATDAKQKKLAGAAAVSKGLGTLGGGYFDGNVQEHRADAEAAGNGAGAAERDLEQVNENAEEAREMRNRTLDFLENIQEQKAEADRAIWAQA